MWVIFWQSGRKNASIWNDTHRRAHTELLPLSQQAKAKCGAERKRGAQKQTRKAPVTSENLNFHRPRKIKKKAFLKVPFQFVYHFCLHLTRMQQHYLKKNALKSCVWVTVKIEPESTFNLEFNDFSANLEFGNMMPPEPKKQRRVLRTICFAQLRGNLCRNKHWKLQKRLKI